MYTATATDVYITPNSGILGFNSSPHVFTFTGVGSTNTQLVLQGSNQGNLIIFQDDPSQTNIFMPFTTNLGLGSALLRWNGYFNTINVKSTYTDATNATGSVGNILSNITTGTAWSTPVQLGIVTGAASVAPGQVHYSTVGAAATGISTFVFNGIGSLGIGVAAPTQTLHVQGTARFTNAIYDSYNTVSAVGKLLSGLAAGVAWSTPVQLGIVTGAASVAPGQVHYSTVGAAATGISTFVFNGIGSLGIGTSTPLQALHVKGNAIISNTLYLYNGVSTYIGLAVSTGLNTSYTYILPGNGPGTAQMLLASTVSALGATLSWASFPRVAPNTWCPATSRLTSFNAPFFVHNSVGFGTSINGVQYGATFRTFDVINGGPYSQIKLIYRNGFSTNTTLATWAPLTAGGEIDGTNAIIVKSAIYISQGIMFTATGGSTTTVTLNNPVTPVPNNAYNATQMIYFNGGGAGLCTGMYGFITSCTNSGTLSTIGFTTTVGNIYGIPVAPVNTTQFEIFDSYPIYFNGTRSIRIDPGSWVTSDATGIRVAQHGSKVFVHTFVYPVGAGGSIPLTQAALVPSASVASATVPNTPGYPYWEMTNIQDNGYYGGPSTVGVSSGGIDMVDTGYIAGGPGLGGTFWGLTAPWATAMADLANSNPHFYAPSLILGYNAQKTAPSFVVTGDSRMNVYSLTGSQNSGILTTPLLYNKNPISRVFDTYKIPHMTFGKSGETLTQEMGRDYKFREYMSSYADYEFIEGGINDITGNTFGTSSIFSLLAARCQQSVAQGRRPVLMTYPPAAVVSSDNFLTVTGQTTSPQNAVIQSVNTFIRNGILATAGAYGFFDYAAVLEDGGSTTPTGRWKAPYYYVFKNGQTTSTPTTIYSTGANGGFADTNMYDMSAASFPGSLNVWSVGYTTFIYSPAILAQANWNYQWSAAGIFQTCTVRIQGGSLSGITVGLSTYQLLFPYTSDGTHPLEIGNYLVSQQLAITQYPNF